VSDAVRAIDYAVANGASISNLSWGGNEEVSQALYDAIKRGRDAGRIFVAGAGNGNFIRLRQANDVDPLYPASLARDNIVAAASTAPDNTAGAAGAAQNNHLRTLSNCGGSSGALAAPGVNSLRPPPNNTCTGSTGTPTATAHVTGALALARSQNPEWDYRQVIN